MTEHVVRHRLITPAGEVIDEVLRSSTTPYPRPPYSAQADGTVYVWGQAQRWSGPWRYEVLDRPDAEWRLVAEGVGGEAL